MLANMLTSYNSLLLDAKSQFVSHMKLSGSTLFANVSLCFTSYHEQTGEQTFCNIGIVGYLDFDVRVCDQHERTSIW